MGRESLWDLPNPHKRQVWNTQVLFPVNSAGVEQQEF